MTRERLWADVEYRQRILRLDPIPPALFRLIKLLVSQRQKGFNTFRFSRTRLSHGYPKTYRIGR